MDIHVVKQGETINSIAESYGVSADRIIRENELSSPDQLVPGQTIVITYPERIYIVKEGDTLESIATENDITVMQLYRNNAFLIDRDYIYPGETIVISYKQENKITTIGYALPFINEKILRKTLPYLTYLFIYNYRLSVNGNIDTFYDDTSMISIAKEYGTAPIMLVTTLTAQGTPNVQTAYEILLSEQIQDQLLDSIIQIMNSKGYVGINMTFLYLTETNEELYNNFTRRVSRRLTNEGYLVFVTVDPGINVSDGKINFAQINYTVIGSEVNGLSFTNYVWGTNVKPPSPVSSITNQMVFLNYVASMVPTEKIYAGIQIIAYDWELPYVVGFSRVNSLSLDSAIKLAGEVGVEIQFDELSQTPYFLYVREEDVYQRQHIVWFIDARTVNSLVQLIIDNNYSGPGVWNVMNYYPQFWLVINSQFQIIKLPT